ncbi:PQQ-binding-like beta-propeller repeat protein [Candidatus Sumerlaeota bacterium]|nr:PQQ-binding-like beta-propeller repeat protein [Candidatus Sumerlaeota bacterium]
MQMLYRRFTPALLIVCLMIAQARGDDWQGINGNLGNRKSNETIGSIDWSSASPPTLDWTISTPAGFSSFTVADGKAFTLITRSGLEYCVAINIETSVEIWAAPMSTASYPGGAGTGDGPRSTPTADGERVYVMDNEMMLYCFNDETGAVVWSKNLQTNFGGRQIQYDYGASPLLEGELIIVSGGGAGQFILAFNRTDGALVWQTDADEYATHSTPVAADIHGVRQIVFVATTAYGNGTDRAFLISVNAATGVEIWRSGASNFSYSYGASPVVCGNYVYFSEDYNIGATLYQVNADFSTTLVWENNSSLENYWSTPVYYDGYLYGLYSTDNTNTLKCVAIPSGTVMWSQSGFTQGGVILVDDKLIALRENGDVYVVEASPSGYSLVANAHIVDVGSGKCWSSPSFSDNYLYVRSTQEGARFEFSTLAVPPLNPPSNPGADPIGTNSITWTWQDNSTDETGFKVYAGAGATAPGTVTHTTAADVELWEMTSLAVNTQYAMQVQATDGVSDGDKTDVFTAWTLAATPAAMEVTSPTVNSLVVTFNSSDGNPAGTEYALHCVTGDQWVQPDGTLSASAAWQTAAAWGTAPLTVTGLNGGTQYTFAARARNGADVETSDGPSDSAGTDCTLTYAAGIGGTLTGASPQIIPWGGDGTTVEAVADEGYIFNQWSDASELNPRTDTNVTADINVTADFNHIVETSAKNWHIFQ